MTADCHSRGEVEGASEKRPRGMPADDGDVLTCGGVSAVLGLVLPVFETEYGDPTLFLHPG
ncbi:hypothetical protein [Halorhabdus rudnickae]|uniref:hypothetical protein n=1 Tax=Halorhabdus rudnickae TaxID=1775544 RepID=UPI0010845709|nr:hypothetical protein [Halorhabdus rudnickae]